MIKLGLAFFGLLAMDAAAQIICGDADLRVIPTGAQDGFTATPLQPVLLSIRVVDGCGQPLRLVAARAEFSNGDVPVPLLPAFEGQWGGIWTPRNRTSEDVQIIFTAINAGSDAKTAGVAVVGGKLLVPPNSSGELQVDPSPIRVSSTSTGSAQARTILLVNPSSAAQSYTATLRLSNGANWMRLENGAGSVAGASTGAILVVLNPSGLAPGTYVGSITVVAGTRTTTVPVTFAVSAARSQMEISPPAITFNGTVGGAVDPGQQLIVRNTGSAPLDWSAQATTISGGAWLAISAARGTTPADGLSVVQVSVNPAGLVSGDYFGLVRFSSGNAANSPQIASVHLRIGFPGSPMTSFVRPSAMVFGGDSATQQTLSYFNATAQPVQIRLVSATQTNERWLSAPSGTTVVPPGQTVRLPVSSASTDQTSPRFGAISVVNVSTGTSVTVPVVSVASAALGASAKNAPRAAVCTPAKLSVSFTSLNGATPLRVGEANPIQAAVIDNCGAKLAGANGDEASFRAGSEKISMRDIGGGSWIATWSPRSEGQQTVYLTGVKFAGNRLFVDTQALTVTVQGVAAKPRTAAGGIVNAASFGAERIAPGSLITIFGAELSDGIDAPRTTPIPTILANTRVELGGLDLPLFYSSPRQLNAQVPYNLSVNTDLPLVVTRGSQQSPPESVIVTPAQPAVFTTDQSGRGQGVVLGPDQRTIADSAAPVRAGDALVIYCTGLGATSPAVPPGQPAPSTPSLARTELPVTVTVGGQNAQVLYSGLAPGFAGLYQVNAIVPAGVQPGNAVELKLRVADLESPPVTIAVRN
jgi:uncharacterized protein (TIGR03437 family)